MQRAPVIDPVGGYLMRTSDYSTTRALMKCKQRMLLTCAGRSRRLVRRIVSSCLHIMNKQSNLNSVIGTSCSDIIISRFYCRTVHGKSTSNGRMRIMICSTKICSNKRFNKKNKKVNSKENPSRIRISRSKISNKKIITSNISAYNPISGVQQRSSLQSISAYFYGPG